MLVKQFLIGGDRNYAYLAADAEAKEALIVDPSYSPQMILDFVDKNGLVIKHIFNTHDHYDHTNGNDEIYRKTGIKPLLYNDSDPQTGQVVSNGAKFPLGSLEIQIIHTPGHTTDSMCVYVGDALFTGDTLFVGKVGGTGFGEDARQEYDSLHKKLMILPEDTRVLSGHNYGTSPESTIGNERRTNPFILQPDFDSFVDLKKNWAEYKIKHGIK